MKRSAGILMHITSLPSTSGAGDMGQEAYAFANFLHRSNQRYWQILPLTPVSSTQGYSPYSSTSAMAGNALLISIEKLIEEGWLSGSQKLPAPTKSATKVDFEKTWNRKILLLKKAYSNFVSHLRPAFESFCDREAFWLDDFALFTALRDHFGKPWYKWPVNFRQRKLRYLLDFTVKNQEVIRFVKWQQFIFFRQWTNLKRYCHDLNISIIGDVPFYVSYDSVDVWSRPEIFKLKEDSAMDLVAGVPPDYFNKNGQMWGMPVYHWHVLKDLGYDWWIKRLKKNLEVADVLRLDHFRAFHDYWEVPAGHKTAIKGQWRPGPGYHFFETLRQEFGRLPFLAEDLGDISPGVRQLRKQVGLPGMKVLQFAFGNSMALSEHIPHNFERDFFVYTGTHDNNTTVGWFTKDASAEVRQQVGLYMNQDATEKNIHERLIRLAYASVAKVAIIPLQDVLGLDERARMNVPASTYGNWTWRLLPEQLAEKETAWLRDMARLYNRTG